MPGRCRVTREVGHVQRESCLGPDGGGDALEEDDYDRSTVFDMSGLRKGRAESLGCLPSVSLNFRFVVPKRVLTCDKGPNEQRQAKHRHDERLGHEHVSQAADVQPKQRQLDQNEEEEAQQLRARDVGGCREVVREVVELRPDGRDHDGEALAALEGLRPEPDTSYYAPNEHCKVRASHAERGPR